MTATETTDVCRNCNQKKEVSSVSLWCEECRNNLPHPRNMRGRNLPFKEMVSRVKSWSMHPADVVKEKEMEQLEEDVLETLGLVNKK